MRWGGLTVDEMRLLETTFWSAGNSRHRMAERFGFSKSKANAPIAGLVGWGLLAQSSAWRSSGGRRAENLQIDPALGVLLGVDIGATSLDVAVMRPDLTLLARHGEAADVGQGPSIMLAHVRALMRELLGRCRLDARQVLSIGISVPGPVDFASGQLVDPPLMPGWDGFSIGDSLREDYSAPVFVDNDVNLMAPAELWRLRRWLSNFLVIKVGTGIGCGIVCHAEAYRGAAGCAGDVGHICVDLGGPRCHCGNLGCVEDMAGPAITRMAVQAAEGGESEALAAYLHAKGRLEASDVGRASRIADAAANAIIQRAGGLIGRMLAPVVNFFNPSHVFIGGGMTRIGPLFLAAVRQNVYQRSLALSSTGGPGRPGRRRRARAARDAQGARGGALSPHGRPKDEIPLDGKAPSATGVQ